MKGEFDKTLLCAFFSGALLGIGVFAGVLTATGSSASQLRDKAVEAGHAEYYLDENNERQWRWKPIQGDCQYE